MPTLDPHDPGTMSKAARLQALKDSGLLRHDVPERLDTLCEAAARLLNVPCAQVNVLDAHQQTSVGKWPTEGKRVMPVKETGCQEVVLAEEPVVVPNTLLHPTMCVRQFVTEAGTRAYLGVPIFFAGEVIGAFCVIDFVVRNWTVWDISGLQGLARLSGLSVARDAV